MDLQYNCEAELKIEMNKADRREGKKEERMLRLGQGFCPVNFFTGQKPGPYGSQLGLLGLHFGKGQGLCSVNFFTGHSQIWTRVQEWTRVQDPMYPVKKFTRHKPGPLGKIHCCVVTCQRLLDHKIA